MEKLSSSLLGSKGRLLRGKSPKLVRCKKAKLGYEEDGAEKKLFLFFRHEGGSNHSLYALDVPNSTTPIPVVTTTTTDTTSTNATTTYSEDPQRATVDPVLLFGSEWSRLMTCVALGKQLYFFGGVTGNSYQEVAYPRDVFVLDLTSISSLQELRPYRDQPRGILKPGPPLLTGKMNQIAFVADGMIFVLSGQKQCPYTGVKLQQFECLTQGESPQWKVLADPPFGNIRLSAHVIVDRTLIVSGYIGSRDSYVLYSYHLDEDSWCDDFRTSGWSRVPRLGFFFSDGSQFIGGSIYSAYTPYIGAVPVVVRLRKHEDGEDDLWLGNDDMYDAIKYKIPSPRISSTLTPLGDSRICFVQAGNPLADTCDPDDFNSELTYISISVFDALGDRGESPRFLTSAHYVTFPGRSFVIDNAYFENDHLESHLQWHTSHEICRCTCPIYFDCKDSVCCHEGM